MFSIKDIITNRDLIMPPLKTILLLNLGLITPILGAESTIKILPRETLEQIQSMISPAETQKLWMAGDRVINTKTTTYRRDFIKRRISESDNPVMAQKLYDALPIDKTDPRGIYNLINHADILLQAPALRTPEVIDFLVSVNVDAAVRTKFEGLLTGQYGYLRDIPAVNDFIEAQVARGNQWAIEKKFEGLRLGSSGYTQNIRAVNDLIKAQIALGNQWAIKMKIYGLLAGEWGYSKDIDDAHALIDKQIALGNQWAIEKKFNGLMFVEDGYSYDIPAAHDLIDAQIARGVQWAIERKIEGLIFGRYGYPDSISAAHYLIDAQIARGNQWAIEKKFEGLRLGSSGYLRDIPAANKFILSVYGVKMSGA